MIADDHKVFRDGICSLLNSVDDMEVIAEASNGYEVMEQLPTIKPDILIMDIAMGMTSGIDTAHLVHKQYPEIRILVLSMHRENTYIVKMLEAGAAGYLLKDSGSRELINAIRSVASGDTYYSSQVSTAIVEHLTRGTRPREKKTDIPLTRREIEILKYISEEFSNAEIAEKLFISIRTVDTHRRNLLEKLGVKNTAGLVKYAIKKGLIDPN